MNLVFFTNCRFICEFHHIEAFGPTGRAKRCVDAKINTLESEGKCSPSHGKSTKRASQFDLKLTREKTKVKFKSVSTGIPNISQMDVSASFADTIDNKRY